MKEFFEVVDLETVFDYVSGFAPAATEIVSLAEACGRVMGEDIIAQTNLPDFARATMDGYAVAASSTYGASEANPAYVEVQGRVEMGHVPSFGVVAGEAAKISTGGMLPAGTDSVVMIEHTASIDETTIEIYKSVAPGQNSIAIGEDFKKGEVLLTQGQVLRPQEIGLLAAFGISKAEVFKRPVVGIISTGDEVVAVEENTPVGKIRDINTYTLSAQVLSAGGIPVSYGIVPDDYDPLYDKCKAAMTQSDMVLISGGSSMGMRDYTLDVVSALPESRLLFHGIPVSPGKPTILAKVQHKPFWGIPGQVVSAMVVFDRIVKPFLRHIAGLKAAKAVEHRPRARLTRNLASAQGRIDYVRVRLEKQDDILWAEPVLGKSGLINTMVKADGLIEIGLNAEGLDQGTEVEVILI